MCTAILDEDECSSGTDLCTCDVGLIGCISGCVNNLGSYACNCNNPQYMLDVDRVTCVSKCQRKVPKAP